MVDQTAAGNPATGNPEYRGREYGKDTIAMSSATSTTDLAPARSAPDTPTAPAPAPSAAPSAAGPAAAVWAALTASPGATAAAIADTVGITRAAAGRELGALRAAGRAVKTPGVPDGRRGTPAATWTPAAENATPPDPAPGDAAPGPQPGGPGPQDSAPASKDPAPRGDASDPGEETAEPLTPRDHTAGSNPAPSHGPASDEPSTGTPDPAAAEPGTPGQDTEPGQDSPAAGDSEPAGGEAGDDSGPAAQAAEALRELADTVGRARAALAAGDPSAALAEAPAIRAGAAEAARQLKAAAAGHASPATRPGGLRDLVDAHLHAHPGTDFTAGQIAKVLTRSAGAVSNALDRLTTMNRADLTCEAPRRYQAVTPATAGDNAPS
jgi:hypothetical protein